MLSCKKDEPQVTPPHEPVNTELKSGLPKDPRKINGYLFLSKEQSGSSSQQYYSSMAYAAFTDPARDLGAVFDHVTKTEFFISNQGIVFVGQVKAGDKLLEKTSMSYRANGTPAEPIEPLWRTDGNQSFRPLNVHLQRPYPSYHFTTYGFVFSRSKGGEITPEDIVQNADSVIALVATFQPNFRKRIASAPGAKIVYSPEEVTEMSKTYSSLTIVSCNYSHIIQNDKVYLFELATPQVFHVSYVD